MELKTYQGNSMAEALEKVKQDLGKDAVILHTRTLTRGGVLGVGSRRIIEITASADAHALHPAERRAIAGREARSAKQRPVAAGGASVPPVMNAAPPVSDRPSSDVLGNSIQSPASGQRRHSPGPRRASSPTETEAEPTGTQTNQPLVHALQGELSDIRNMVRELLQRPANASADLLSEVPEDLRAYYTRLIQNAVAEELAREIIDKARQRLTDWKAELHTRGIDDKNGTIGQKIEQAMQQLIPAAMSECIEKMLPPAEPIQLHDDGRCKVVALVGPTGVGKTTTIAKLAAHFKLRENKRVGLITIDTYRIAAVDQLRAYADIMSVPLEVVFEPAEMEPALRRMSDLDLILIDTSGRNQKDVQKLGELKVFLEVARQFVTEQVQATGGAESNEVAPLETHLLLACTAHPDQLVQVVDRFASLGVNRVVFTKLDEAVGLGVILNVATRLNMRLSYLTTGQDVPDDIEVGHRRRIAEMVLAGGAPTGESASMNTRVNQVV